MKLCRGPSAVMAAVAVVTVAVSLSFCAHPINAQVTCSGDSQICKVSPSQSILTLGPSELDPSDPTPTGPSKVVNLGEWHVQESYQGYLVEVFEDDATRCSDGLVLPLFAGENLWDPTFRAILYLIAMFWCFMGVAIVADRFMSAIEVITSREKEITYTDREGNTHEVTVLVWNETVANLTLMALGSSAPEILLAVIETISDLGGPIPEDGDGLGPSTIVGSAAFNLLIIIAICIVAIPDGEVRTIKEVGVFGVTAVFSIVAYLWMVVVLSWNSKDEVELWEALVTLALFPALVGVSYAQDQGYLTNCFRKGGTHSEPESWPVGTLGMGAQDYGAKDVVANLIKERGSDAVAATDQELANYATRRFMERKHYSIARYVVNASRSLTGGHRVLPKREHAAPRPPHALTSPRVSHHQDEEETKMMGHGEEKADGIYKTILPGSGAGAGAGAGARAGAGGLPNDEDEPLPVLSFASPSYDVFENEGHIQLKVVRSGNMEKRVEVRYETSNGTAIAGDDYVATSGSLIFAAHQVEATVTVEIIDDNEYEPDENFFVSLHLPYSKKPTGRLGHFPVATVTIIDDDTPGEFEFSSANYIVSENSGTAEVGITRSNGVDGTVKIRYWTEDSGTSAKAGTDYEPTHGELVFEHNEKQQTFEIPIIDTGEVGKNVAFSVLFEIINYPECGAKYGPLSQATVSITANEELRQLTDKVSNLINLNLDKLKVSTSTWGEQFVAAMTVYGEDDEDPSPLDYVLHFFTFFWKILFAFIPPTSFRGGWLTFWFSLAFIGLVTAVIGDMASIFGCAIGLTEGVTAITFVALGTSLPDTFASRSAACNDEHADASIVNVTGSNSVNVFLGLGLPWTIAAIYHEAKGTKYIVPSGSLVFSVAVFCVIAVIAVGMIVVRRVFFGGELGGPRGMKIFSFSLFVFFWLLYIVLSALKSEDMLGDL